MLIEVVFISLDIIQLTSPGSFHRNHKACYLKVTRFPRPRHSNDIDLAMVRRFKDNRQYKVYRGNHRWDSKMMEFSKGTGYLSSIHNKVSPVKTCSEFWISMNQITNPKQHERANTQH